MMEWTIFVCLFFIFGIVEHRNLTQRPRGRKREEFGCAVQGIRDFEAARNVLRWKK